MRRLRKFLALSPADRRLAAEAAVLLTAASLTLSLLPFRLVARWLEKPAGQGRPDPDPVLLRPAPEPALVRPIGHAVVRAARHLPWRPLCLPQALATRAMLRRRGLPSTLYFGVALEGRERVMTAHAWVTVGETGVIGAPARDAFTVLARYAG